MGEPHIPQPETDNGLRIAVARRAEFSRLCREFHVLRPELFGSALAPRVEAVVWLPGVKLGRPACQRQRNLTLNFERNFGLVAGSKLGNPTWALEDDANSPLAVFNDLAVGCGKHSREDPLQLACEGCSAIVISGSVIDRLRLDPLRRPSCVLCHGGSCASEQA